MILPEFYLPLGVALLTGWLSSLLGPFLVLRRFALLADGVSHVALAGLALGVALGVSPELPGFLLAALGSLAVDELRRQGYFSDAALGLLMATGLSLGLLLLHLAGRTGVDLEAFLFGHVLSSGWKELLLVAAGLLAFLLFLAVFYKELFFVAFDEEAAGLGIPVRLVSGLLSALAGVVLVLSVRVVGALLAGALTIIPVLLSLPSSRSFGHLLLLSPLASALMMALGLGASFLLDLPPGPSVVLAGMALLGLRHMVRR